MLQDRVIRVAHEGHMGMHKMRKLLKERVWFHEMNRKIESTVAHCVACQASNGKVMNKSVIMSKMPHAPWSELSMDFYGPLGENGNYLLVITDMYSRYPFVNEISKIDAKTVCPV